MTPKVYFIHDMSGIEYSPADQNDDKLYRPFIDELELHLEMPVQTISGSLADDAPGEGLIVHAGTQIVHALNKCSPSTRSSLARRVVALNVSTPHILERVLEPFSLAGAIDTLSFTSWKRENSQQLGASGLFAHRDLGLQLGARCVAFSSAQYCCLSSSVHRGLPHLLADYLKLLSTKAD